MKLALIVFFACALLTVPSYAQKISLHVKDAPLHKVFSAIEKQSGYLFWYDYSILEKAGTVTVRMNKVNLQEALKLCLKGKPLAFTIVNKTIVISSREPEDSVSDKKKSLIDVRGSITDSAGHPLEGVSIALMGLNLGAMSDRDGNFSIAAPPDAELSFSFVDYEPLKIVVRRSAVYTIVLGRSSPALDEVVVVGYGSLPKKNITGAISTINPRAIENQPVTSLDQAIGAQAAGVRVSQITGSPGGGATVRIRGTGSITAGNEPLYVIDGIPVEGSYNRDLNPLATINPNDIDGIQILKDASAVAIYGSRGSNGVIIITTRRGRPGKLSVNLNTYAGVQQVATKMDMLDAREYALYNREARNNAWADLGGNASDHDSLRPERLRTPPMFANAEALGKGTDWQDEIFRPAALRHHQLSVSNGNSQTQYLLSLSYFRQDGIVINTGFERYSFRLNLDSKLSDRIRIGLNISPSYSRNDVLPVEDEVFTGGILGSALAMPPTVPVYNADGTFSTLLSTSAYNVGIIDNPVAMANELKGGTSAYRTMANLFGEWDVLPELTLRASIGGDLFEDRYSFYWPSTLGRNGVAPPVVPQGDASTSRNFVWLNENTLRFEKKISRKNKVSAVAGISNQRSLEERAYMSAVNFPNDLVTTINAGQITSGGTARFEWALLSYFARVNYSYDEKYIITATARRDGSSRFGANNRWGTFPSLSAGWNVSRENFMRPLAFISDLKVRASFGYAGNNSIGDYNAIGLLNSNRYVFGSGLGSIVNGLRPINITNPNLGWEVMKQFDIGAEIGLIRNRVSVVVDYFEKLTSDLLLDVPVPGSTGFSSALRNIGTVANHGWEFTLSTNNLTGRLKWNSDVNLSFYRNRVLSLGPAGDPIIRSSRSISGQTHITAIGEPIGSFYGYEVIGVYRDQADVDKSPRVGGSAGSRPGDLKFKDNNNDGVITPLDMKIIGNNDPAYTFGITNQFSYDGFTLSVLIDGVQGVEVLNGSRRNIELVSGSYSRRDVLGRWQSPQNPGDGRTPRANVSPTGGNVSFVSSLLIEDASYVRIRNINLRYALPSKWVQPLRAKSAYVFLSAQNAYTFTAYKGFNPEQNLNGRSPLTPGVDYNGYPLARVISAGFNIALR